MDNFLNAFVNVDGFRQNAKIIANHVRRGRPAQAEGTAETGHFSPMGDYIAANGGRPPAPQAPPQGSPQAPPQAAPQPTHYSDAPGRMPPHAEFARLDQETRRLTEFAAQAHRLPADDLQRLRTDLQNHRYAVAAALGERHPAVSQLEEAITQTHRAMRTAECNRDATALAEKSYRLFSMDPHTTDALYNHIQAESRHMRDISAMLGKPIATPQRKTLEEHRQHILTLQNEHRSTLQAKLHKKTKEVLYALETKNYSMSAAEETAWYDKQIKNTEQALEHEPNLEDTRKLYSHLADLQAGKDRIAARLAAEARFTEQAATLMNDYTHAPQPATLQQAIAGVNAHLRAIDELAAAPELQAVTRGRLNEHRAAVVQEMKALEQISALGEMGNFSSLPAREKERFLTQRQAEVAQSKHALRDSAKRYITPTENRLAQIHDRLNALPSLDALPLSALSEATRERPDGRGLTIDPLAMAHDPSRDRTLEKWDKLEVDRRNPVDADGRINFVGTGRRGIRPVALTPEERSFLDQERRTREAQPTDALPAQAPVYYWNPTSS